MSSVEAIAEGLKEEAGWIAAAGLAGLLFYFLKNPSTLSQWASMLSGAFERISGSAARHSAATDIQGRMAAFVKSAHMDALMPYGLKIKWVKTGAESYVERSDVVVIMEYRRNSDKNFVAAAQEYTSRALLPSVRHDLPRDLMTAADLVVQEKMIRSERPDALGIFMDEVAPSALRGSEAARLLHESLRRLDRPGFFSNIFLNEVALLGEALLDMDADARGEEVRGLARFLERFWDRAQGEDVPLEYVAKVFKLNIILVARQKTMMEVGTDAYLGRAKNAWSRGFRSVYVTGSARDGGFAEQIIRELKETMPEKLEWVRKYRSRRQSASYDAAIAFFRR